MKLFPKLVSFIIFLAHLQFKVKFLCSISSFYTLRSYSFYAIYTNSNTLTSFINFIMILITRQQPIKKGDWIYEY